MKVTPLDIRRKEFKRSVRGYADEEVDLFLDEVADEFERLYQENADLQERIRRLDEQLATHLQLRDALEKTLISAQFQADETKANAQKESELILRDAELKARGIVSDSYSEVQKVQQALVQLKHLEEDFRFKFGSLLQGHLKVLAEAPLNMPAGQTVVVEPAPVSELAAPVAEPIAAGPVATGVPAAAETPFVVPAAIEEVPEYPAVVAAPVRTEPGAAPEFIEPVFKQQPVPEPPLSWPEEPLVLGTEETATLEHGAEFATTETVGDDSVTLIGDEDPLKGFFFAPKRDGAADGFFEADQGGKSKARDFEW